MKVVKLSNVHLVIFYLTFFVSCLSYGVEFDLHSVPPAHQKATRDFLDKTFLLLPTPMRRDLEKVSFVVQFKALNESNLATSSTNYRILGIDIEFLELIISPQLQTMKFQDWVEKRHPHFLHRSYVEKFGIWPAHRTTLEVLQGLLIHGMAHVYDLVVLPKLNRPSISERPEFLNLAGFPERGFLFHEREYTNEMVTRSPDFDERLNAREGFAVNLEYLVLDPYYHCKRPSLNRYLRNEFKLPTFGLRTCPTQSQVLISNSAGLVAQPQWKNLDFARLYQIHYLFAGGGGDLSGTFGHAMLRLVFCSPTRTRKGPECLEDKSQHVVVSFRAALNELRPNMFKGISGDFPTFLFLIPFPDVLIEYNRKELRDVYSLPLQLTQLELRRLLERIIEVHWSYRGGYRFFSSNCAHETMGLLQAALLERGQLTREFVVRPDSLYQLLIDLKLAQGPELNLDPSVYPFGQLYRSQKSIVEKVQMTLKDSQIIPADLDVEDILEASYETRLAWFNKISSIQRKDVRKKNLSAFSMIQDLIADATEAVMARDHFVDFLEQRMSVDPYLTKNYLNLNSIIQELFSPSSASGLKEDYGIPLVDPSRSENMQRILKMREGLVPVIQNILNDFKLGLPKGLQTKLNRELQLKEKAQKVFNQNLKNP